MASLRWPSQWDIICFLLFYLYFISVILLLLRSRVIITHSKQFLLCWLAPIPWVNSSYPASLDQIWKTFPISSKITLLEQAIAKRKGQGEEAALVRILEELEKIAKNYLRSRWRRNCPNFCLKHSKNSKNQEPAKILSTYDNCYLKNISRRIVVGFPERKALRYISSAVHRPWGDSCFSIYQISWIKLKKVTFFICKLKTSLGGYFVYNLQKFRGFCQVHFYDFVANSAWK